jgi:hypothetical protein
MNHSSSIYNDDERRGGFPPARGQTSLQWLPPFQRKRGLSSGSTRGMLPPTFAIASPGSCEGEAMAKAGGTGMAFLIL